MSTSTMRWLHASILRDVWPHYFCWMVKTIWEMRILDLMDWTCLRVALIRQARFHGQFQHGMDFLYLVSTLEHVCGQSACGQSACGPNAQMSPKLRADSSHAYMHTCLHAYMLTCLHAYTRSFLHANMHKCFHRSMLTRVLAYMLPCASLFTSFHVY